MDSPRERRERAEELLVCSRGVRARESAGRPRPEPECEVRTCFQRDIDRIIHCKSFRRLKHKTQVFLQPEGDHYRTRLTHTLEVAASRAPYPARSCSMRTSPRPSPSATTSDTRPSATRASGR